MNKGQADKDEILHELTRIALGKRTFKAYDKSAGDFIRLPPSEGASMKALELLGKSLKLFSDNAQAESEPLEVEIRVVDGGEE